MSYLGLFKSSCMEHHARPLSARDIERLVSADASSSRSTETVDTIAPTTSAILLGTWWRPLMESAGHPKHAMSAAHHLRSLVSSRTDLCANTMINHFPDSTVVDDDLRPPDVESCAGCGMTAGEVAVASVASNDARTHLTSREDVCGTLASSVAKMPSAAEFF
jgi:hypothetical protein